MNGISWGFGDPLWEAFYRGRVTLEVAPTAAPNEPSWYGTQGRDQRRELVAPERVALVPVDAYEHGRDGRAPTQDVGMTVYVGIGELGNPARQAWRTSRSLQVYVAVPSSDLLYALATLDAAQLPILGVPPVQAAGPPPDPPVGGAVSLARVQFGHLGVQNEATFDAPPGLVQRLALGGSAAWVSALLAPKYWPVDDTTTPGLRVYVTSPTSQTELTSPIWNLLSAKALVDNTAGALVGPTGALNPNKVSYSAWIADSALPPTTLSQPMRRFYGSLRCTNAAGFQDTKIPVAWFASSVTLVGDARLTFTVETLATAAGTQTFQNLPFNQAITLPAGATAIVVHDPAGIGPPIGVPVESLFEADFSLSF